MLNTWPFQSRYAFIFNGKVLHQNFFAGSHFQRKLTLTSAETGRHIYSVVKLLLFYNHNNVSVAIIYKCYIMY